MKGKEERYPDYALFKGLQPLELMGIQADTSTGRRARREEPS